MVALSRWLASCAFLSLLLLAACSTGAWAQKASKQRQGDTRQKELAGLVASAWDGIISLDGSLFDKYAQGSEPRPYTLVLFLDAESLHNRLPLQKLKTEFALAAAAYKKEHGATPEGRRVVFATMEFSRSQAAFGLLGVKTLPHVCVIPPSASRGGDGVLALPPEYTAPPPNDLNSYAETIAQFVEASTGLKLTSPIVRPRLFDQTWFRITFLLGIVGFLSLAYKIISSGALQRPQLWVLGALAVYYFSVSGGMYGIIRGVPLVGVDQQTGQPTFFSSPGQGQLGAEGFIIGFLHLSVGLLVAFLTHVAPSIENPRKQRSVTYILLAAAALLFLKDVNLYTWKTGYGLRVFWPKFLS
eukprot:jgi/Chlat1/1650/Chrsp127S00088